MTYRYRTVRAAATSTQTAHNYRASAQGEQRVYERVEPSLNTVLARRDSERLSPERFEVLFGDLPSDDEG
jgi:hypothetical protein